jgi:hypothetical protein
VISLRYHIVSLVAVFLALALGIVVGSTVLQEGTVSVLRATSEQVRQESEKNSRENVELQAGAGPPAGFGAASCPSCPGPAQGPLGGAGRHRQGRQRPARRRPQGPRGRRGRTSTARSPSPTTASPWPRRRPGGHGPAAGRRRRRPRRPPRRRWSRSWPTGSATSTPSPRRTASGPRTCSPGSRTPTSWRPEAQPAHHRRDRPVPAPGLHLRPARPGPGRRPTARRPRRLPGPLADQVSSRDRRRRRRRRGRRRPRPQTPGSSAPRQPRGQPPGLGHRLGRHRLRPALPGRGPPDSLQQGPAGQYGTKDGASGLFPEPTVGS